MKEKKRKRMFVCLFALWGGLINIDGDGMSEWTGHCNGRHMKQTHLLFAFDHEISWLTRTKTKVEIVGWSINLSQRQREKGKFWIYFAVKLFMFICVSRGFCDVASLLVTLCVCVCVCVKERDRQTDRQTDYGCV